MKYLLAVTLVVALNMSSLLHPPVLSVQGSGRVTGIVTDINDARVSQATVIITSDDKTWKTTTNEDGTYQIDLPVGTHRIRVAHAGFCPFRRPAFRLQESATVNFNFILIPCEITNDIRIVNGRYEGETDRYRDPFREEVFPVRQVTGESLQLMVRYGKRRERRRTIEYRGTVVGYNEHAETPTGSVHREKYLGVTISYDSLTIRADRVDFDSKALQLIGEGHVVIEDCKQTTYGKRAEVQFRSGGPVIKQIR